MSVYCTFILWIFRHDKAIFPSPPLPLPRVTRSGPASGGVFPSGHRLLGLPSVQQHLSWRSGVREGTAGGVSGFSGSPGDGCTVLFPPAEFSRLCQQWGAFEWAWLSSFRADMAVYKVGET